MADSVVVILLCMAFLLGGWMGVIVQKEYGTHSQVESIEEIPHYVRFTILPEEEGQIIMIAAEDMKIVNPKGEFAVQAGVTNNKSQVTFELQSEKKYYLSTPGKMAITLYPVDSDIQVTFSPLSSDPQ